MSALAYFASGLALVLGKRPGSGINRHPACRLFGMTEQEYAGRMALLLEPTAAAFLDLLHRRLMVADPALAERVRLELERDG